MKRILGLILSACLMLGLCACGGSPATTEGPTWQEQYDLGVRYISEGNYKEAVIAFAAAIKIDPKRAEAYIELANVYIAQGDTEAAENILNQARKAVGEDEILSATLNRLFSQPGTEEELRSERVDYEDGRYGLYEYDNNGNVIQLSEYESNGKLFYTEERIYDTQGNLESSFGTTFYETGAYITRCSFDSLGRIIESESFPESQNTNGQIDRETYSYSNETVAVYVESLFLHTEECVTAMFEYTMSSAENSVQVIGTGYDWNDLYEFNYLEVLEQDSLGNEVACQTLDSRGNPIIVPEDW